MAQPDVVDQDGHVQVADLVGQAGVVRGGGRGEVDDQCPCERVVFLFDLRCYRVQLALRPGDQQRRVARPREVEGELFTDPIGCAGDHGPGFGGGAERAELKKQISCGFFRDYRLWIGAEKAMGDVEKLQQHLQICQVG